MLHQESATVTQGPDPVHRKLLYGPIGTWPQPFIYLLSEMTFLLPELSN